MRTLSLVCLLCALPRTADAVVQPDTRAEHIGAFVVEIYEDTRGHIWFGTMSKGVARYDGQTLTYLNTESGLPGNTVSSITEDRDGILWFGTHDGLSRYDGKTFRNYNTKDGLINDRITRVVPTKDGTLWISTFDGVSRFDGTSFTKLDIPDPTNVGPGVAEAYGPFALPGDQWIRDILIDDEGNVWFSRDGYGVCRYDGTNFKHFTKRDGLATNSVFNLEIDSRGHIWMGCVQQAAWFSSTDDYRKDIHDNGGVCVYDGKTIRRVPAVDYEKGNNVYTVRQDRRRNIWVSNIGQGIFCYDGKRFTNYKQTDQDPPLLPAVQSFLEDKHGNIWVGCSGGLFRLVDKTFVQVTTIGPWPKW